ncbi:MAG: putative rane protein [Candidatus Nitrosotenuis sp.]|nr:putative rane protein [Candidatus Nitrosotenuis sp.]
MILTNIVFLSSLGIIILSLVSIIFPALITSLASTHKSDLDPFEIGPLAFPMLASSSILLGIGFAYYKKKLPALVSKPIEYFLNFEISPRIAFLAAMALLAIYIGATIGELSINEEEQWPDYEVLKEGLKIWPSSQSDNMFIKEQNERYVRIFLLYLSQNILQNIKILPFVASILLVVVTYFITYQISGKRFSGIISMVVLLQSYTFLKYDTIAVYENFWVLFYILSLYAVYKKWYVSPISYLLSFFTKAFAAFFFPMSIFFIYRAKLNRKKKIMLSISYGALLGISAVVLLVSDTIYDNVIRIDPSEFWMGFSAWSYQLRFDFLMVFTILPLTVGLFFTSRRGIKEADAILVLILGSLLAGPALALFTDFYYILPYRYVPLVVFFSVAIGVFLSRTDGPQQHP